jgi:hypothetical protein
MEKNLEPVQKKLFNGSTCFDLVVIRNASRKRDLGRGDIDSGDCGTFY